MTRTDRYIRATKMTNRIYQLQDIYGWSHAETAEALDLIDEELPMHLSSASMLFDLLGVFAWVTLHKHLILSSWVNAVHFSARNTASW